MRNLMPALVALLFTLNGLAQTPVVLKDAGPVVLKDSGLKKLNVFIGTWKAENDPGPAGGPGVSAVSTCRWSANGKFMIADQLVTNGGQTTNNLSIYSYNPDKDEYTLSLVGVPGREPFSIPVTYKGDEFYYLGSYTNDEGKKIYTRTVNTFTSAGSYTFKVQSSDDGEHWVTSISGKSTKIH
ncbi:MAG TPA: DUF1579 family protein [Puia sp.]|nr:DUF1579 family protein [Puia sp.]